jgi:hypothetical protein
MLVNAHRLGISVPLEHDRAQANRQATKEEHHVPEEETRLCIHAASTMLMMA